MALSPTKQTGTIGELAVMQQLLSNGYEVFRSVGDCSHIDLIACKNHKLHRIQVKTRNKMKRGIIGITNATSSGIAYSDKEVDYIAIFVVELNSIAYVPVAQLLTPEGGARTIVLRTEPPLNGQKKNIHEFSDFTNLPT